MLQSYRRFILIVALILLTPMVNIGIMQVNVNDSNTIVATQFTTSYESHAPIVISSDADFTSQGWPGNGSAINPYVIENLSIVSDGKCIEVDDTTAYFSVRNCQFSSASPSTGKGVDVNVVQNGEIENCTFSNFYEGVIIARSANCSMFENSFYDCVLGTYLFRTQSCTFSENIFISCGFRIFGEFLIYYEHSFSNNMVNNKELGFFLNETSLTIDGSLYGQIFLIECNNTSINSGSFDEATTGVGLFGCFNVSLVSASITRNYYGLDMSKSPNCSIINCEITENGPFPIIIYDSAGAIFSENVIYSNFAFEDWGAVLVNSENCTFILNEFYDNADYSLYEGGHGTTLVNNTFYGHPRNGVWFFFSDNLLIVNNSFYGNGYAGIDIHDVDNSLIYLNKFGWNLIRNAGDSDGTSPIPNDWDNGTIGNYWDDYSGTGVYEIPSGSFIDDPIDHFPHILVDDTNPTISHPGDVEIEFDSGSVVIHWSVFDQFPLSYEIFENSSSTDTGYWRNGMISYDTGDLEPGLYNYTVVCSDGAGNLASDIVFVTVIDSTSPVLSSVSDLSYELGSTNNLINWTASDPYPGIFQIYIDEVLTISGQWNSSESTTVNVDDLSFGVHNVTAVFYDLYGNYEVDEISIEVVDTTAPTVDHPSDMNIDRGFESVLVSWNVFDLQPSIYEIYINGTLSVSGVWTGTTISITVNETSAVCYLLELQVHDSSSNQVTDELVIHVQDATTSSTTTTTTGTSDSILIFALTGVGVVAIIIVVFIIKKRSV